MGSFADIGALVGVPANNELSYQKGLALGANTQNAMQQARERVRQNTAMEQLTNSGLADELGLTPGLITAIQAGLNPQQITSAAGDIQERGFRAIAGSPDANVDAGARNRALTGLASGPVETFKAVGSKGYQDVFHPEQGVIPLGSEFSVGAGGGDAAVIQMWRALGLLDESGHVTNPELAMDVHREMTRATDLGGVPGEVDLNPFRRAHAAPAPVPAGLGAELAPAAPAPGMPPAAAPAAAARPVTPVSTVAGNTAAIEKAKVQGKGAGEAAIAAPSALADIDKLEGNVTSFLQSPGFSGVYGNIQGQPLVKSAMGLLDQDVANSQAALKNIDAQTFGIAIQKMRGLGQLSNAEGLKVTDAFSRASNPLISEPEARKAWAEVLQGLHQARVRAVTGTLLPAENPGVPGAAPAAGAPAAAAPGAAMSLDAYLKSKGF